MAKRAIYLRLLPALCLAVFGTASQPLAPIRPPTAKELRICADPSNLPFSNARGEGFENKLAEMLARDLHESVTYFWAPERENFVRKTLNAGSCDVVMGVPAGWDEVETTRPYYTSRYVFVSRRDRALELRSITDPRLKTLKIGVHLAGDSDAPPVQALGSQGISRNVVGFLIYGDTSKPNPPARVIEAVEAGQVDVAAVWGPLGGYFARQARVPLVVTPITGTERFAPLRFDYATAIGVRRGNTARARQLDGILARHASEIRNLLLSYGVPLAEPAEREPRSYAVP